MQAVSLEALKKKKKKKMQAEMNPPLIRAKAEMSVLY